MSTVSYNKISQNISRTEINSVVEYVLRLVLKNEQVITLNLKYNVFCDTNASICHKTFHQREDLFLLSRGLVSTCS